MDPLTSLREFTIRGELDHIVRSGDLLFFGDPSSSSSLSLPAAAETAYRSKQGSQYTLETLLFFLNHANLKHTDYLQLARSHRLPAVTFTDRKPLLDYLHGRTSSSDQILQFQTQPSSQFNPINNTQFADSSAVAGNSLAEEPPAKKIRVPEKVTYLDTIKHLERPLKDRDSLLENRNRDFYSLLAAAASSNRKKDEERYRRDKENGGEEFSGLKTTKFMGGKGGEGVPIILVPSAMQTLITIYNVKEFLEDGVFVPTEVKVKQMREVKAGKPECVTVQKMLSRGDRGKAVAAYEVRDKPSGMKAEDWERVVAVFVLGKEWQFKDWPFKDHVEIFNKIIGFYMRFEDDSVESAKTVKQWNVKIISISKNKRHQDRAAALEVWDRLEEFVRSRSHS